MRLFLANVGPTELTLLDQPIRPPREGGFKVLQTLEALAEDLRMPYIYPALRHLQQAGQFPDRIALFATDQGDRGPSEADTVYFGRAIGRLISFHFGPPEDSVELHLFRGNPNDYEAAFRFYGEALGSFGGRVASATLALTSAPFPLTSALLIHSLLYFGSKLGVIYVGRPGPDDAYGRAHLLDLGQELRRRLG